MRLQDKHSSVRGTLTIQTVEKKIIVPNLVLDNITDFLTDRDRKLNYIYGQWGEEPEYEEGGGPYFVPTTTDEIPEDGIEETRIIYQGRRSEDGYTNNVLTSISYMTSHDDGIYYGAFLVSKDPIKGVLPICHTPFLGIKKVAGSDIILIWDLIFSN